MKTRYEKWRRRRDVKTLYRLAERYEAQPITDAYTLYIRRTILSLKEKVENT